MTQILRCTEWTNTGYGLLYNWYAVTHADKITSSDDWVVPTARQFDVLARYIDPSGYTYASEAINSDAVREMGLTYWPSPNSGATNSSGFNGRGLGSRNANGTMGSLLPISLSKIWNIDAYNSSNGYISQIDSTVNYILTSAWYSPLNVWATQYYDDKKTGASIRLLYTGAGTPTSYTGNDGKVYRVVMIGTQYWLADNLAETKYRNGNDIPEVTGDVAWAALTTGALCAYNNDWGNVGTISTKTKILVCRKPLTGLLYNWWSASKNGGSGVGSLAPTGYHVSTQTDWATVPSYTSPVTQDPYTPPEPQGTRHYKTGLTWWDAPPSGYSWMTGDNTTGFNGNPNPVRQSSGTFTEFTRLYANWWTPQERANTNNGVYTQFGYANLYVYSNANYYDKNYGFCVRLVRDTTVGWVAGETVTDASGNVYDTISANGRVWTTADLRTTKYNGGDDVPIVSDASAWAALTTDAVCALDNDFTNVGDPSGTLMVFRAND